MLAPLLHAVARWAAHKVLVLHSALFLRQIRHELPEICFGRSPPRPCRRFPLLRNSLHRKCLLHVPSTESLWRANDVQFLFRRELVIDLESHRDEVGILVFGLFRLGRLLDLWLLVLLPRAQFAEALAHFREGVFGLPVQRTLGMPHAWEHGLRVCVVGVKLQDALEVTDSLDELCATFVALGPAKQGLHIVPVLLEHAIATGERTRRLHQLQEARGLVQFRSPFELGGVDFALMGKLFCLAKQLDHLFVLVQGQLEALALKQFRAAILSRGSDEQLVFARHAPQIHALFEIDELDGENDLRSLHLGQTDLRVDGLRSYSGHQRALVSLHRSRGAVEGVTDFAVPRIESEGLRAVKPWKRVRAICGRLHLERDPETIPRLVVPVSFSDRLLLDRVVLENGNVTRLVNFVELELQIDCSVLAAVRVFRDKLQAALLALRHRQQRLVHNPRGRPQISLSDNIVSVSHLLYDGAMLVHRLQRYANLVPFVRILPAGNLIELHLNATAIAKHVVLSLPSDELYFEHERGIRWNFRGGALLAVSELGLQCELSDFPLLHGCDAEVPSLDDLPYA
mmetsp:Transcript_38322/g.105560  ORF Transcript_38322/g.105560 Transcript_38322/m.105560 type:complete len:569 (+) Transcript_38322:153-1859(+)